MRCVRTAEQAFCVLAERGPRPRASSLLEDFTRCSSGWVHRVVVLDVQIGSRERDDGRRASAFVQICAWWAIVAL